jgi:hypothetical protein
MQIMDAKCTTRLIPAIAVLLIAGSSAVAVTTHPYLHEYRKKTFGVEAVPPVVGRALIHRGPGTGSFGHRLGTSFGIHVAKNTAEYGVASMRHEDLHYYRSNKPGFGPRLGHALASTVVTRKTTTGRKTVAAGHLSGAATTGLIAGAASGGITLGANAGANVAREFWPRHHRASRAGS